MRNTLVQRPIIRGLTKFCHVPTKEYSAIITGKANLWVVKGIHRDRLNQKF